MSTDRDLARNKMWEALLGSGYQLVNKNEKKHMKHNYAAAQGKTPGQIDQMISLNDLEVMVNPVRRQYTTGIWANGEGPNNNKDNNMNMYGAKASVNVQTDNTEEKKISYLMCELKSAYCTKDKELRKLFNMDDVKAPTSPKDFVDRLKDGKFEFIKSGLNDDGSWRHGDGDDEIACCYWDIRSYVKWIDPDHKKDAAGYKAAGQKLQDAYTDAQRTIAVMPAVDGLNALKAFESTTYS